MSGARTGTGRTRIRGSASFSGVGLRRIFRRARSADRFWEKPRTGSRPGLAPLGRQTPARVDAAAGRYPFCSPRAQSSAGREADTARRRCCVPTAQSPASGNFPFTTPPFLLPAGAELRHQKASQVLPEGTELSAERTSKSPTLKSAGLENAVSSWRRTGRCDGILFKSSRRSSVPPQNYSLFWEMTCLARVASGALGNLRVSSVRRCLAAAFLLS